MLDNSGAQKERRDAEQEISSPIHTRISPVIVTRAPVTVINLFIFTTVQRRRSA
jgi:hypothetical protein